MLSWCIPTKEPVVIKTVVKEKTVEPDKKKLALIMQKATVIR